MSACIPIDIMIQILKHLPVKNLLRLRVVCKWMNRLIDSPSFIKEHLARQKPRFIAMYHRQEFLLPRSHSLESSLASSLLARHPESPRVDLIGTLHGIVCFHYVKSHIILRNLSIRRYSILPLPEQADLDRSVSKSVPDNTEDDYLSIFFSGFWIDYCTTEFKIIMLKMWKTDTSSIRDAILYSSTEQHWQLVSRAKTGNYETFMHCPAVVIKGMAYWLGFEYVQERDENGEFNGFTKIIVLSFDFEEENFRTFEGPWLGFVVLYTPVLYRLQDSLSLMIVDENECGTVYSSKEDSWISMFKFQMNSKVKEVFSVVTQVEERGKEASPEEMRENMRILATTCDIHFALCKTGADGIVTSLKSGFEHHLEFAVAHDFVCSLLFP